MKSHSPLDTFLSFYLLREYNRDITLQRMSNQLKAAAARDRNQTPEQVLATLEEIDPTRSKQYVMWLVREYAKHRFKLEDKPRLHTLLKNFEQVKSRIEQKDINRYTLPELENAITSIMNPTLGQSQGNKPFTIPTEIKDQTVEISNTVWGLLTQPKTERANCVLGSGTKWCTARINDNEFDDYNDRGPLYIWRDRDGEKYQFHFKTQQFKDSSNDEIDRELINYFRTSHPVLKKFFKEKEAELLQLDMSYIYDYAMDVIGGRWPEAEQKIKTNAYAAYIYARDVIKGRWPEAEPTIVQYPEFAFKYIHDVIKGRWPEAEPTIMRNPLYACLYASEIIKGRWPEAEPTIMTDPRAASRYAIEVIKGRWPEAEPTIRTSLMGSI